MKQALVGSAIVHVLLTAALFVVRTGKTVLVPGPDVVEVALVDPSLAAIPAPMPGCISKNGAVTVRAPMIKAGARVGCRAHSGPQISNSKAAKTTPIR